MDEKLLDEVLNYFFENKHENIIPFNIRDKFGVQPDEVYLSILKLYEDSYLTKISPGNLAKPEDNIYKISPQGILFVNEGGYINKLEKEKLQNAIKNERENLELQKLRGEIDIITNTIIDYPSVKRRAARSELIALGALLVSIILMVIEINGCN